MSELLPCPFCGGEAHMIKGFSSCFAICDECKCESGCYPIEAEAIAAWNSRATGGTLTAEQVRKAIERNFGKVAVLDDGEPVEWRDDWVCKVGINYKAIADELNSRVERTCKNEAPRYLDFLCSECGFVHYIDDSNCTGDGNEWNYCPNCGARVIKSDQYL